MNKSQLIDTLADRFEGSRKDAAHALDAVLDTITRQVAKGEKVAITGFGSFEKAVRNARWVRNPQTGERVKTKKKSVPKFSAGADLKNVVSGAKKLPALPKPAKKAAAPAKKAAASVAKKAAAPAKKAATAAKKAAPAKKAPAKKAPAAKKAAPAKKAPAKKAPAAKKAAPAKKAPAKKAPAAKKAAPAKKAPAKKAPAKKAPAKKAAKKA
ncbi:MULTISPECIES: HU family DNA-binding protein [Pimelobacter]|uniref:HU family DNA-binding protein n=1 Tax=Pimelobacter TaxID=2044 RepID=UPI001C05E197|nr:MULTISPECIES: HU family DNA-binding protein [Pimelobacter]MBU2698676.1 DNA-binding protein [Pimelobacter sp. 30-1]UUW89339.1 HU family DNA-binding protein [Pimelobacter simplex]UUW93167.1 HU family DNA-binding protein [Pimelobacter simplex]